VVMRHESVRWRPTSRSDIRCSLGDDVTKFVAGVFVCVSASGLLAGMAA